MPQDHASPQRRNSTTRPPSLDKTSRYLSPILEQRILSWRHHASPSDPRPTFKVKSAPPSLSLSKSPSSSNCACGGKSDCVCSAKTPGSSQSKMKSYYASKKKPNQSSSALASSAPGLTTAFTTATTNTATPMTPISPSMPMTSNRPDWNDIPSAEQMMAYRPGTCFPVQYGQATTVPMPETAIKGPTQRQEHRIAGGRDPVTQNYWRKMFPPAGGPVGPALDSGVPMPLVQPGLHPPGMFGMHMGRPWGF